MNRRNKNHQLMKIRVKHAIILILLFYAQLNAQNNTIDNIYHQLKNASLAEKVELYNQLSSYYVSSDAQKAIHYANQALKIAHSLNDHAGKAKAYGNLGMGYYFFTDYDSLLSYYQKSLTTYESIGDQSGITGLASRFYRMDKFQKALDNYKRSLLIYLSNNDVPNIVSTYLNMGNVYKGLGNQQSALENYNKALAQVPEDDKAYQHERTALWENLGDIYYNQGEYDKALAYYQLLHSAYLQQSDSLSIASVLNNMGGVYYQKNQLPTSHRMYREALDLQIKQNDHHGASVSFLNLARIYAKSNDNEQAILQHQKSILLAKAIGNRNLLQDNYRMLALIYKNQNNFKKAYEYQVLYANVSDVLAGEKNAEQFVGTLMMNDIEQKKSENDILEAKNDNYRLRLEKENLSMWRLSFGFTILVVLILVSIIYYRYYLKRKENENLAAKVSEALQKQEEQQQIIVHQASLSSLGELAAGIAHEINQPIQNISLSAEGIKFELMESQPNPLFIQQSTDEIFEDIVRVREIVDHIRIFSSGQKEDVQELFSLSECVNAAMSMIGRQYRNHHIQVQLNLDADIPQMVGNPHKMEQIIHNLLSNARDAVNQMQDKNPALKKEIVIETGSENGFVFIKVRDNGVGIPYQKRTDIFLPFVTTKPLGKGTGLGLSIAYRLTQEMSGRIEVQSRVMDGTIMKAVFPVAENNS